MRFHDGYHDNGPALVRAALHEFDRERAHPTPYALRPVEAEQHVQYGMRLMLAAMAGAAGLVGLDWLDQLRAAVAEPLSDRARQAVEFDSDVLAAWESRRPTGAELAQAMRETEPDDDPDDDEPMVGGSLSGPHTFSHGLRPW